MWKTIKPVLAGLFSSKKFLMTLAGVLVWVVGKAGLHLDTSEILPVLILIGTYIGATGLEDFGKAGNKALVDGLGKQQPPEQDPE